MEETADAFALRNAVERAMVLATTNGWTLAGRSAVIASLRPLQAPVIRIAPPQEIGDSHTAHATLFTLRRGEEIALHDHPGMTVITKVLHGQLRMETYEWLDSARGVARDCGAREIDQTSDPLCFDAEPGTLHRITALTDCSFVDLFSPWYDHKRPCTYYRIAGAEEAGVILQRTGETAP